MFDDLIKDTPTLNNDGKCPYCGSSNIGKDNGTAGCFNCEEMWYIDSTVI